MSFSYLEVDIEGIDMGYGGIVAMLVFTGLVIGISLILTKKFGIPALKTTPSFMEFEPLKAGERWMLLIWLVMFFFNIVGEEILWSQP